MADLNKALEPVGIVMRLAAIVCAVLAVAKLLGVAHVGLGVVDLAAVAIACAMAK
jgi:hypothetical protein